jgi:competence protein ComEC
MKSFKLRLAILITLVLITITSLYIANRENRGLLTVAFLNIGQGDAIFIEAPNGNQLLLDGGPDRSVLRELGQVMPFYDHSIDVMIESHPDSDHISGLNDVLEKYQVNLFMEPGVEAETSTYKELKNRLAQKKIKVIEARRGMVIDLGSGVSLQILFPVIDPRGMETNNASIVARLVYGQNKFMLTGDSPKNIEEYLVSLEKNPKEERLQGSFSLKSDVLKAGHHGSKTSSGEAFVQAVAPKYAIISAGLNNKYGHPNQETLDIFDRLGIQVLRTDRQGRIVFNSDGANLIVTK